MNLSRFEDFVFQRQLVASFKPDVPQEELLLRLVSIAQRSPSMMNLQPTRYVCIKNPEIKELILRSCWVSSDMSSAPMLVAFTGSRDIHEENEPKESFELLFSHKPYGIGWLFKALIVPILRFFSPIPELPAVHKRAWLYKEICLSAMHFMVAAETAGLSYKVIDFFDENRVRKALRLPRTTVIPLLIALGYPKEVHSDTQFLSPANTIVNIC